MGRSERWLSLARARGDARLAIKSEGRTLSRKASSRASGECHREPEGRWPTRPAASGEMSESETRRLLGHPVGSARQRPPRDSLDLISPPVKCWPSRPVTLYMIDFWTRPRAACKILAGVVWRERARQSAACEARRGSSRHCSVSLLATCDLPVASRDTHLRSRTSTMRPAGTLQAAPP